MAAAGELAQHPRGVRLRAGLAQKLALQPDDRVRGYYDVFRGAVFRDLRGLVPGQGQDYLLRTRVLGRMLAAPGRAYLKLKAEHLQQLAPPRRTRGQYDIHYSTPL